MTLRLQLLLVCLLTLVLPWAGWQLIRETESALREGQQQMLAGTAQAIADSLAQFPGEFLQRGNVDTANAVYVHPLRSTPLIDGYFVDWALAADALVPVGAPESPARYALGVHRSWLFLYVTVDDDDVRYAAPGRPQSGTDRVVLVARTGDGAALRFVFAPEAPGALVAGRLEGDVSAPESRIQAHWQDAAGGYRLEARVPRQLVGNVLGLEVNDSDAANTVAAQVATFAGETPEPLVTPSPVLESVVSGYVQPGLRLVVTDRAGWRLASAGDVARDAVEGEDGAISGWMRMVYDALLEPGSEAVLGEPDPTGRERRDYVREALDGRPATSWFRSDRSGRAIVAVAQPVWSGNVQTGVVILQHGTDAILSLTNRALTRLVTVTVIAMLVVGAALLGYASWLSIRIRRLSGAALEALDGDPARAELPSTRAVDEIGDLSRSFSSVLKQLGEYNEYLRTLASKLSHEMRTPLTIVTSSLENLEREPLDAEAAQYTARARSGAQRMQKILQAMSEASRVEELIENAEPERFDLHAVLTTTVDAYADAWSDRRFIYHGSDAGAVVDGSPELVVQLLDKLVDNAVDFSRRGDVITVRLAAREQYAVITVHNPGPPLPAKMRSQLFDSMVSVRGEGADRHLGLGLFIARLIAVGHGGTIAAFDADGGVAFEVRIPLASGG